MKNKNIMTKAFSDPLWNQLIINREAKRGDGRPQGRCLDDDIKWHAG